MISVEVNSTAAKLSIPHHSDGLKASCDLQFKFNTDIYKYATWWQQQLTLEGLQEQLVVGLNELQVGLLGCSHRRGRLVQAVGFSSRTKTHRVAPTWRAVLLWSHCPKKMVKVADLQSDVKWCKEIRDEEKKKKKETQVVFLCQNKRAAFVEIQPVRRNTVESSF